MQATSPPRNFFQGCALLLTDIINSRQCSSTRYTQAYVFRPAARKVNKQKEPLDPVKQAQLDEAEVNPIDLSTLFMTTKAASSLDPSTTINPLEH